MDELVNAVMTHMVSLVPGSEWILYAGLYVLVNLSKRIPPPTDKYLYALWYGWESLMVFAWDSWGMKLQSRPLPARNDSGS
jgi:hypothetical protein